MTTTELTIEQQAIVDDLNGLVGARVVQVAAVLGSDSVYAETWPVLIFETPSGEHIQVEVSRDAEGNGPGHLFIGAVADE